MEKGGIIFCKTAVEDHENIKKPRQDMSFYAKVVWKVAGLKTMKKNYEEPPQVEQSGLIKICEHKQCAM
jgi:hypothetical protein